MKLVLFGGGKPGVLTDRGVVDVSSVVSGSGQQAMQTLITNFESLRPELTRLATEDNATPLANVSLEAPLPSPAKVLCMGGNYREFGAREPAPMWGFYKSSDAVIGPGGTVVLPDVDANIFHHEAEVVLVFGKAGKSIPAAQAMDYIFGYTCGVDVSARMPAVPGAPGRVPNTMPLSPAKSHPTFAPLGPCIVTKDEVPDPHKMQVRLRVDGELRGNYNTDDLAHSIPESVEWATAIESVKPGDVLFMGTNHQGLGAMQDGDTIEIEIDHVGSMTFGVRDPLQRRWNRGVDELTAKDVREGTGGPGSKQRPLAAPPQPTP